MIKTSPRRGIVLIAFVSLLVAACWTLVRTGSAGGAPTTATRRPAATPHAAGFGSNWTVYHQNGLGMGVDPAGTDLSPLRHAWTSPQLDGQLYGEPLVYGGRVVIATENDTVYELAANTGKIIWQRHLGTPVPANDLPCGDISPTVGITGTPVIDPGREEIFVEADELAAPDKPAHHLFGFDIFTGKMLLDEDVDPPGSIPANQLQRTGLAIADGQVVMGFGGNDGDCADYHGWIVAVPESGGKLRTFEVDHASGDDQGAVWMGGAAPEVDGSGNIWFTTGNGSVDSSSEPYDDSDGVLELSPTLSLDQYYAPATWGSDNASDLDFAGSVALVGNEAFTASKSHNGYLLDRNHLGGIGHQYRETQICQGDPDGGEAYQGSVVYVPCGNGITAVKLETAPPSYKVLWASSSGSSGPAIVASGLVWTISQSGNLYGLSPSTGNPVVTESLRDGVSNHFSTPTVADGLLLAPSTDEVDAWKGPAGLPPPPAKAPTATSYWVAAANGAVFPFGGAPSLGSATGQHPRSAINGFATTPDGKGYWLVDSVGQVFAFGDAHLYGSTSSLHTHSIVGIASTPDGNGYWLVASDGGVFSFGNARFHGSEGGKHLNKPIVGIAGSGSGGGYWLVAADGGIFAFSAPFYGSAGSIHLTKPIVGMTVAAGGHGYRLVASDGGIFSYGHAPFYGSLGGHSPGSPVTAVAPTRDGGGYWMVDGTGGVYAFGDARFEGSPTPPRFVTPAVGIAAGA
jgi:outer membrane protein assembly factor BamB